MAFIGKDFDQLTGKQRSKILKGSVVPRPIAWITTKNEDGSINLAPFSYFSLLSPSLISVSFIRGEAGKAKDTLHNLLREKEAVVHIPDRSLIEAVDRTSDPLPPDHSEVTLAGLELIPGTAVGTPGIREARIRLEAVLEHHLPLTGYDETSLEADLVILRVKYAHLREDIYDPETEYISHEALDPLARLGGPHYASSQVIADFTRKSPV